MRKKFIVGVEGLSTKQQKLLRDFLRKDESGWWHWLDGFWLVDAATDELTVESIRREIVSISEKASNVLVLEVSPVTWSTFGPKGSFSKWLEEYWMEDE